MAPDLSAPDLWVFGYGSLIFRADFPFIEQRPATINHWARRFWQGSTDHRGTPEAPGRVVTLVHSPEDTCWGMAYLIAGKEVSQVLDHLDYREKGGYERLEVPMSIDGHESTTGLTYLAAQDNENYLGHDDTHSMARQISQSIGPSGPNREYLLQLEASLQQHHVTDDHVFELADELRAYESNPQD
jgi:cation transport protein ChaC